jgi:phage tail-like protein
MAGEFLKRLSVSGPDISTTIDLPVGEITIGRQEGNELRLNHRMISRQHSRIKCTAKTCHVTDLGSANGTLVNGERLEPDTPRLIKSGDTISIGPFEMKFEQIAVVPAKPAAPAEPKKSPPKPAAKAAPPPPPPPPAAPRAPDGDGRLPIDYSQAPPGLTKTESRYLQYLPGIYHTDFMKRFLAIFESILAPIEWNVDNFDLYLNPETTPSGFLPWLASWFSITFDSTWTDEQQRELLLEAHEIFARRGTRWALSRILEIYTKEKPEIVDIDANEDPFTFNVKIPLKESEVDKTLIEQIIDASKPAHTSYVLSFDGRSAKK